MKMRAFLTALAVLALALPAAAQAVDTEPELVAPESEQAGSVAHGAEEVGHEELAGEEHDEAAGHDAHHEPQTFLGLPAWIWKLANMILFLGLLWWAIRGPFWKYFAKRKKEIGETLESAAERKQRAERMEDEIRERLAKLEEEIEGIRSRAAEDAERISVEIAAAAERDSEKVREAARSEIEQRLRSARQELRSEAARLAAERAERIVESSITDADRQNIFDRGVEQIEVKS